jgi:hypothetical protein
MREDEVHQGKCVQSKPKDDTNFLHVILCSSSQILCSDKEGNFELLLF